MNLNLNNLKAQLSKKQTQIAQWSLLPLTLMIAWIVAQWFWIVYGAFTAKKISTALPQLSQFQQDDKTSYNIDKLLSANLFGEVQKNIEVAQPTQVVEVKTDAPDTRLPLILRGIYASTDPKLSNAIIEGSSKEQELYFVDDAIKGSSNVTLARVLQDRIILNRAGQFETLKMEEDAQVASLQESLAEKPNPKKRSLGETSQKIDKTNNRRLSNELRSLSKTLQNDPASLAGMMNAVPVMEQGQIRGFKVSPGKNPALFSEAGLRRNDVVTNVNGIELDSISNGLALKEQLKTATELTIQLTRGDQQISLVYSLNENIK